MAEQGRIAAEIACGVLSSSRPSLSVVLLSACSSDDADSQDDRDQARHATNHGRLRRRHDRRHRADPARRPTRSRSPSMPPPTSAAASPAASSPSTTSRSMPSCPVEVSGPGVSITVELTNGSASAPSTSTASCVELVMPGDRFATPITTQEDTRLVGEPRPWRHRRGHLRVQHPGRGPRRRRGPRELPPPEPTVVFQGNLADV